EKHSNTACQALSKLIRKSPNIQKALVGSGFVEMATYTLIEEGTPQHIQTNILTVILDLITNGADVRALGGLYPVLEKFAKEEDSKQQEITMKAQIIQTILISKRITGSSSSSEIQELKRIDKESQKQLEEQKRQNEELKKQISDLKLQLEEAKPEVGDVAISIDVPSGSYTKKDGEYTYTSTSVQYKVFPIKPVITQGITKCEFKGNFSTGSDWVGVMKSGLVVPFGSHANTQPYAKDCMLFCYGGMYQNSKPTMAGNKSIKADDLVAIEVNMNTRPRTAHLFINNVQQPGYISGLPEKVQYYFQLYSSGFPATVQSLKRLSAPTVKNVSGGKEVKWE
ncbi:MAG: hypothetical protein EZS28_024118, partial [Streblomastix strix]